MKKKVVGADIVNIVRQFAEQFPEAVYKKPKDVNFCSYIKGSATNGCRGCIIGQALRNLRVRGIRQYDPCHVPSLLGKLRIEATRDELLWMTAVQQKQDKGTTWGESVEHADKYNGMAEEDQ